MFGVFCPDWAKANLKLSLIGPIIPLSTKNNKRAKMSSDIFSNLNLSRDKVIC